MGRPGRSEEEVISSGGDRVVGWGRGKRSPWSKGRQQGTQVDQTLEGMERVLEAETGKPGKKSVFNVVLCVRWARVGGRWEASRPGEPGSDERRRRGEHQSFGDGVTVPQGMPSSPVSVQCA